MKDNKMSKNSHVKHEHKNKKKQQDMSYEKPHEDYHAGFLGDIIIGLLILGLGLVFVIPFYFLVPAAGQVFVVGLFLLVVGIFVGYMLNKNKHRIIKPK